MFKAPTEKRYTHVYSKDPALNTEHEDFNHEVWVDTGDDKHIPCVSGARPVRFLMKRLSTLERRVVEEFSRRQSLAKGLHLMLGFALDGIDPFVVDGKEVEVERVTDRVTDSQRVSDVVIEMFDDALYKELVGRASIEEYGSPK